MKKLKVQDILNVMSKDQEVECSFTAYGVSYASSWNDGMRTVQDCLDGLRYDCLNALVTGIRLNRTVDNEHHFVQINGEIVH